jgi:transglutaminase-like putative cysteine protease
VTLPLRLALLAMTVVDLAFVHATEDASLVWLAPMYAIALASARLSRLEGRALYRWGWNLGVIAIFLVLVRHTAVAGPRFLLEDGLRLAAVCQVHLLCNLGARQKPDLLFFNSFLIAVVTAFLTQDLLYSALFLVYAPLLVLALSLYAAGRAADAEAQPALASAVCRDAVRRAGAALVLTLAVFVVWPRDFHRKGIVVESLAPTNAASVLDLGFSEDVRLDREGTAQSSDRIVAQVHVARGSSADVSGYFRGAMQLSFDGSRWSPGFSNDLGDPPFDPSCGERLERASAGDGPVLSVELEDASANRIFAPLETKAVAVADGESASAMALLDGTLAIVSRSATRAASLRYELALGGPAAAPAGRVRSRPSERFAAALDLGGAVAPSLAALADEVRHSVPAGAPQHDIVEATRHRLASRSDYMPAGTPGAATDVESFVSGRAGGHCEHFATALALLLRQQRIPCRLVTGYLSDEWDPTGTTLTIRRRHAHAWVEVCDPTAGWMTVDPTPAAARSEAASASLVALAGAWIERVWERIVLFDERGRKAVFAWCAELPLRAARLAAGHLAVSLAAVAGLVGALTALRRRRIRTVPLEIRDYHASLRKLGIAAVPGETPRELLARAATLSPSAGDLERLASATRRHELARFAR